MFIMDSLCCSTMVYFFLLKAQLKKKNYAFKWPQHTSSNQITKWLNNFFFTKCKKAIVLYDKVVDFLGWERKVILCKKCFFPSCFVEQKKS